ncbi:MAG: phospholipid carrier-dependent glycosyltransferase [Chloroflexota bacterium]
MSDERAAHDLAAQAFAQTSIDTCPAHPYHRQQGGALQAVSMKRFLLSAAWLGFLVVFVLLGVPLASYHGDETTQLYSSHDYVTLFIRHDPQALLVEWPIDNELEYLRIADSTVSRYTVGLAWHLAGYTEADLPDANFNWSTDYAGNQALGLIPDQHLMVVMRLPSAIFLALSIVVMFGIGYRFGGLPLALFVSALYSFNPVVLLNGRRALQEGSLLFFGLLTVLIGIIISQQRERRKSVSLLLWLSLILAGAFTLLSKNNGFIYIAAAFLWIFLPELLRPRRRALLRLSLRLALCGILLILLFIALSPGLWSNPLARIRDASAARLSAMNGQMSDDPEAPTPIERRISDILTQPYIKPLAHFEAIYSNTYDAQSDLIAAYDASLISGIHFGILLGVPLTLLALVGIVANFIPRARPYRSTSLSIGLTTWLIINLVILLWLPLPWQRYFLSLIPVVTLFTAVGLSALVGWLRPKLRALPPALPSPPVP